MSQAGILNRASGPVPPAVATSYVTQNGTAVPLANILIVNGFDSTENNDNGIITKGGVVGTGTSNEVDIVITNRITGTATTTDAATPQVLYSFSLGATPGAYLIEVRLVAYNVTDAIAAGYTSFRLTKTDGIIATDVSATPGFISEETTMTGVLAVNSVSGNNLLLTVNGLAGKTINWLALTTYNKVT